MSNPNGYRPRRYSAYNNERPFKGGLLHDDRLRTHVGAGKGESEVLTSNSTFTVETGDLMSSVSILALHALEDTGNVEPSEHSGDGHSGEGANTITGALDGAMDNLEQNPPLARSTFTRTAIGAGIT